MRGEASSIASRSGLILAFGAIAAAAAAAEDRNAPLVEGILAAWKSTDVVCLGEDHGRKYDSELRIALVRQPRFASLVQTIVVEFANPARQDTLDRFILEGAAMSRDEIAVVWRDANGAEVWESPIYEAFLRAVRDVNLGLPRDKRVRVLGGDTFIDWRRITRVEDLVPLLKAGLTNRGGNIRRIIAEQVLDRHIKALAIYGAGHCEKIGGGFPGDLAGKYPPERMWSVSSFYGGKGTELGKQVFHLGDKPAYIVITGTKWAATPAAGIVSFSRRTDLTVGDVFDAIVFHGDVPDAVVPADTNELKAKYGAELERRRRLLQEAQALLD